MIRTDLDIEMATDSTVKIKSRDSRIDWVGHIPSHWGVSKFKHLFFEKKKVTNPAFPCGSISFGSVIYKDNEKIPVATKASYQVLEPGEFLINPLNLNYDLISLRIALSDKLVVVSSGYIIIKDYGTIDRQYFKWLLHRFDVAFMKQLGAGVRQTIGFADLASCELPVPPLAEQTRIANFLDDKTAKIDKAIAQKERLIELLKERKQILIHRAVTRGLNPNVKLKDSGVEWIGMVPEGWELKRFTKEVFVQEGPGIMANDFQLDGIPLIRISGVKGEWLTTDGCNYLKPEKVERRWRHFKLELNDLIISASASTDLVSEVNGSTVGCVCYTGLIRLKPLGKAVTRDYLKIFLTSKLFSTQTDLLKTGSTISHFGPSHLQRMIIIVPPIKDQERILGYVRKLSLRIQGAIGLLESSIVKLHEYKTSLIDGAVRGKYFVE